MSEPRRRDALRWAGSVLGLVLLGGAATVLGGTAWPLVGAVLVVTTAVHAPRAGWRVAFFLTLLAAFALEVSFAWFTAHSGWSFATDNTVVWTLSGLCAVPFAAAVGPPTLTRRQLVDAAAVLATPALVLAYLAWTSATGYYEWLGWAMAGDSANNMLLVRTLIDDGGLLRSQGNPAPLSTVIYAAWAAPGVPDDAAGVVKHVVLNGGQLTLLTGALLSILSSLTALRTSRLSGSRRVALAMTAGLLPWLWCVMGYSFRQGFQNAAPAMAILLLAWSCWAVQRRHPVASVTGQILATWAMAATWGPVLLIPALWFVGVAVWQQRRLRAAGRTLLLPFAAMIGAGVYAVLVTLKDLTATGGVPGVDGGTPNYDPWWALGVGIALLALSVACYRWLPRETVWGYWLLVPGLAAGVYQLSSARVEAGLPYWGYYPIKLTWIVMATALLVLFSVLQPPLARVARAGWGGNGLVLAFVACMATMFWTTPPLRPATIPSVLTPSWLNYDTSMDRAYERLFALMEENPRTIVSDYGPPPMPLAFDSAINFWLLQSGSVDLNDPLRNYAYSMNSADPAALCGAINQWGGDVRVVTRAQKLERNILKACPDAVFTVEVIGAGR
ncbi:membrane hypothetical protein [metagenome]|uniref:Glycosyltransferase RgtA/B/C/D-like domain-containing protein n=1 Tax=metagenome TaxID=256318 RepID=A0A2P2C1N1_9ZZZZ